MHTYVYTYVHHTQTVTHKHRCTVLELLLNVVYFSAAENVNHTKCVCEQPHLICRKCRNNVSYTVVYISSTNQAIFCLQLGQINSSQWNLSGIVLSGLLQQCGCSSRLSTKLSGLSISIPPKHSFLVSTRLMKSEFLKTPLCRGKDKP